MKRCIAILSVLSIAVLVSAKVPRDSIYQGWNLKLDLATPIMELARSKGRIHSYELATNVSLLNRYYPTLEVGFAHTERLSAENAVYKGDGGFFKVGLDISALKKAGPDNQLYAGIRIAYAGQKYNLYDVRVLDTYWNPEQKKDFRGLSHHDCFGEVVLGVQVKIVKGFNMGWYVRLKMLFTKGKDGQLLPYYLPGFVYRQSTNFGINYYIGWRF